MIQKEAFNAWWEENHEIVSHPENTRVNRKFTAYKSWEAGIQFVLDAISGAKTEMDFPARMSHEFMKNCFEEIARIDEERQKKLREAQNSEPAASMQDDSPRMMAIGQNGNNGEHYE